MSPRTRRIVAVAATVLTLLPGLAFAAVEALFDLSSPATVTVPERSVHGRRRRSQDRAPGEPAQARLRRPPVGLRGHRRPQYARRLQPAAASVDPLLGPDRRVHREQQHGVPRTPPPRPRSRRRSRRDQPGRVGSRDQHAPRRVRRAPRSAHTLSPGGDRRRARHRRASRQRRGARGLPRRRQAPASSRRKLRRLSPRSPGGARQAQAPRAPRGRRERVQHPERDGGAREDPSRDQGIAAERGHDARDLRAHQPERRRRSSGNARSGRISRIPRRSPPRPSRWRPLASSPARSAPSPSAASSHRTGRRLRSSSRRSGRARAYPLSRASTTSSSIW